jgi:hypothetical protein
VARRGGGRAGPVPREEDAGLDAGLARKRETLDIRGVKMSSRSVENAKLIPKHFVDRTNPTVCDSRTHHFQKSLTEFRVR